MNENRSIVPSTESFRIAFVVLHYKQYKCTVDCVNSILQLNKGHYPVEIYIVDNGSNNGSGELLESLYLEVDNVSILKSKLNLGFAQGNNLGYSEAKRAGSNFIIVCNSDLIFKQQDFVEKLIEIYENIGVDIVGPDVFNPKTREHQSPMRMGPDDVKKVDRWRKEASVELASLEAGGYAKYIRILKTAPVYQALKK